MFIACDDIYEHIYWGAMIRYRTFLNVCLNWLTAPSLSTAFPRLCHDRLAHRLPGGPADLVKAMRKVQSQSTSCPGSVSQAAPSRP